MCMGDLSAFTFVCHIHTMPCKPEKGVRIPGTGDVDGCELQCRWWELNSGSSGGASSPLNQWAISTVSSIL